MNWKRIPRTGALVLIALAVLLVLYLTFGDLSRHQPLIVDLVKKATGRELRIEGEFILKVLPTPHIAAKDVTFDNADWASEPCMVRAGHVEARIGLLALFSKPIIAERFRAVDAEVRIEKNEQGESNRAFRGGKAKESVPGIALPALVEKAYLENVTVVVKTGGPERVLQIDESEVSPSESGLLVLRGTGDLHGSALAVDGTTVTEGEPMKVVAKVSSELLDLRAVRPSPRTGCRSSSGA